MPNTRKTSFLGPLIGELETAAALVTEISDELFRRCDLERASIGAHVRHGLDFVNAFVQGARTGSINYSNRERNADVERDRQLAKWRINATISSLNDLVGADAGSLVSVRSEASTGLWHRSSLSREAEFVYSHMVHHHALIKERLMRHGAVLSRRLGVSPSTQEYRDSLQLAA